jgi:hypothetical protein
MLFKAEKRRLLAPLHVAQLAIGPAEEPCHPSASSYRPQFSQCGKPIASCAAQTFSRRCVWLARLTPKLSSAEHRACRRGASSACPWPPVALRSERRALDHP